MTLQELLSLYSHQPYIQALVQRHTQSKKEHLRLSGAKGSLRALIGAAAFNLHATPQLYVLNDRENAEYFQNDLQTFSAQ